MYEQVIAGVASELQAACQERAELAAQVQDLRGQLAQARMYSQEEYEAMEREVKRTAQARPQCQARAAAVRALVPPDQLTPRAIGVQLLAHAEEEAREHKEQLREASEALEVQQKAHAVAHEQLSVAQHDCLDLHHQVQHLDAKTGQQQTTISAQDAELKQLRADVQAARSAERALTESNAQLEVCAQAWQLCMLGCTCCGRN